MVYRNTDSFTAAILEDVMSLLFGNTAVELEQRVLLRHAALTTPQMVRHATMQQAAKTADTPIGATDTVVAIDSGALE